MVMIDKKNMRWVLFGVLVLIVFGMQNTLPKEAVADVDGFTCTEDSDCPCWGELEDQEIDAWGVGVAHCTDCSNPKNQNLTGCITTNFGGPYTSGLHCDTTWCADIEPVGIFLRDNPWAWLKDNPLIMAAIVGLIILVVTWPKQ